MAWDVAVGVFAGQLALALFVAALKVATERMSGVSE